MTARSAIRHLALCCACIAAAGCHSDSSLEGDWFRCGNQAAPDSSCSEGIRLSEGNWWNKIIGSYVESGYYRCSSEPEQSGTWAADWTAGGQVSIMLSPSRGSAWSMTEGMHYSLDGNALVGPTCLMDCSGRPIHWFRIVPSRLQR